MITAMSPAKKLSYLLVVLTAFTVVRLHLGHVVLAALFSHMIIIKTYRLLSRRLPEKLSRWLAATILIVVMAVLAKIFGSFLRIGLVRLPLLLTSLLPRIDGLGSRFGIDLPFDNVRQLRDVIVTAIRENAQSVTHTSGLLTSDFFQIVGGIFIVLLQFLVSDKPPTGHNLFDALRVEYAARIMIFMSNFEAIFSAQLLICIFHSIVTALFLLIAEIPYVRFLTLTSFVLGMLPIIGPLISNSLIIATALIFSTKLALIALIFLLVMQQAQHIIFSHLVGTHMSLPLWQVLLAILLGEAVFGVAGIVLAPAILGYIKEELGALNASPKA